MICDKTTGAPEIPRAYMENEMDKKIIEALDAAESILRYAPEFNTNCGGTKPAITTRRALELVRAALKEAGK
jgi:hypothetical protein